MNYLPMNEGDSPFGEADQTRMNILNLLHDECRKTEPSFHRIQEILDRDPALALEKDQDGKLALHLVCSVPRRVCSTWIDACFYNRPKKISRTDHSFYEANGLGESLKIVQLLLEIYPKSAEARDGAGQLPLHLLCWHGAPLILMDTVLHAHPQATTMRSSVDERLPLHMACARNARHEVILSLIKQDPQAIGEQDSLGFTPLHLICAPAGQADVLDTLLSCPQGHQALQKRTLQAGFLPLHLACRKGASHFLVERLVQAWPQAVKILDEDQKWLPLHYACARLDRTVAENLVKVYPESVLVRDPCGRLPFQIAYDRNASISFLQLLVTPGQPLLHFCLRNGLDERFIHSLLIRSPEVVSQRDGSGSLPIHCASSLKPPPRLDLLNLLIAEDSESLRQGNNHGDCPFHVACKSQSSFEVLRLLMPDPVEYSKIRNHRSELALHLACQYGASIQVLDFLIKANPDSSLVTNAKGNLPVHDLASGKVFSLDRAQFAVQHFSATLQTRNKTGFVPLHLACSRNAQLDSVYTLLRFYPDILKTPIDQID